MMVKMVTALLQDYYGMVKNVLESDGMEQMKVQMGIHQVLVIHAG